MRSVLSILLAILIAAQAAAGGVAICMNGGCCHEVSIETHEATQHSCADHDAAPLVSGEDEHDQDCDCTDVVFSGIEGIAPGRDDVTLTATIALVAVFDLPVMTMIDRHHVSSAPPCPVRSTPGIRRPAHLRTTCMLL